MRKIFFQTPLRVIQCTICALMLIISLATNVAAVHEFGNAPLQDVLNASAKYTQYPYGCSTLTTNKLAALVLSPTWWEVTGANATYAPSPMTMGRYDFNTTNLYYPDLFYQSNVYGSNRRAFWHPGIGAWQLDDGGLGTSMSYGRFDTYYSSSQVADTMSSRYCNNSGALKYVFAPWVACGTDGINCQNTFNKIYDSSSDSLIDVYQDPNVGTYGGSVPRTCRFGSDTATFTCYYVNYTNAQGYTGSWVFPASEQPCDQDNNTAPLASPYYVFKHVDVYGNSYEYRYWMSDDTCFGFNIAAYRA